MHAVRSPQATSSPGNAGKRARDIDRDALSSASRRRRARACTPHRTGRDTRSNSRTTRRRGGSRHRHRMPRATRVSHLTLPVSHSIHRAWLTTAVPVAMRTVLVVLLTRRLHLGSGSADPHRRIRSRQRARDRSDVLGPALPVGSTARRRRHGRSHRVSESPRAAGRQRPARRCEAARRLPGDADRVLQVHRRRAAITTSRRSRRMPAIVDIDPTSPELGTTYPGRRADARRG